MIFGKKKQDAEALTLQRDRIIRFKRVFGTQEGKEVLCDILNRAHILESHGGDSLKEGERSLALYILQNCNINLAEFDRLLKGDHQE